MLGGIVVLAAACWLCIYPVALVAAGVVLLVLVPQGRELLEATARHDEAAFKALVNETLAKAAGSGELDKTFSKWFGPGTAFDIKRDYPIEEIKG